MTDTLETVNLFETRLRAYMRCIKHVVGRDIESWDGLGPAPPLRTKYDPSFDHCRKEAGIESITDWKAFETCYGGMDGGN